MKRNSSSKTGMFNLRCLVAFCLCSAGTLLAIAAASPALQNAIRAPEGSASSDAVIFVTTTVQKMALPGSMPAAAVTLITP